MTVLRFERLTYRKDGQTVNVRLEVTRDDGELLVGYQVDREGTRVQPSAAYLHQHNAADGQVVHVIANTLVTSRVRLVQDYLTGGLVPDGTAPQQKEKQP
jgi:hypothetical protein